MSMQALLIATLAGTVAQIAMVVAGHYSPGVRKLFAVGGMACRCSRVFFTPPCPMAGWWRAPSTEPSPAASAPLSASACRGRSDVPTSLLLLGSISSMVTGAIGGAIGRLAL